MPNNITFLSKHPAYGVVWIQKTYKNILTNNSKVEKTFDWGANLSFSLNQNNNFQLSKAEIGPGSNQLRPKDFTIKMYGVIKQNGQWHGSLLEF